MSTPETQSFAAHYQALQESVDALRHMEVADLDELMTQVNRATQAYQGCQARIQAVRALLADQFPAD